MLELEDARAQILAKLTPLPVEALALGDACGRFLASPVSSPMDLPAFDNSAMDGYAVQAADLAGASGDAPVTLRVAGRAAAGEVLESRRAFRSRSSSSRTLTKRAARELTS